MGSENHDENKGESGQIMDPMSLKWLEKYDEKISKIWRRIPNGVGKCIATVATFMLGISINGDWINIFVHAGKQFGYLNTNSTTNTTFQWSRITLESLRLQNFFSFWISSCIISYSIYFAIGGFLHWYYYVRQRDRAEEWKCQPTKWMSPELEIHEIIFGSCSLMLNATTSSILSCYIYNGGYSTIYYEIADYGWTWFFLQAVIYFIYQDYLTYWLHRLYHIPFLYKHFHKMHHKYKQPTAFSVTAIHPVESLHIQISLILPIFFAPLHWVPFYVVVFYTYYHGILSHSGIYFKGFWWQPWQPDTLFHDNHHQYFHVNFGFNICIWDMLHGTYRRKDRVYREEIFYGHGKSVSELTEAELKEELQERASEIPVAYRKYALNHKLTEEDIRCLDANSKKLK